MTKEGTFLVYCIERYRYYKNLSGSDAAAVFQKYGVDQYILQYFESLHTTGDLYLVQDIDSFIEQKKKGVEYA